jgi:hypothetical protein
MAPETSPSETSPLLGSSNGTVSNGTIPENNVESGVQMQDEQVKEPFPDAQKQLKYIVPAISLGVSFGNTPRVFS